MLSPSSYLPNTSPREKLKMSLCRGSNPGASVFDAAANIPNTGNIIIKFCKCSVRACACLFEYRCVHLNWAKKTDIVIGKRERRGLYDWCLCCMKPL